MSDTNDMRREFEQYICDNIESEVGVEFALQKDIDGNYYTAWVSHRWSGWQAATERATAAKDSEISALRKDALRAATVAFSLMVVHNTDGLPPDAQELAAWLEINAFHLLPEDDGVELLFIDIIRSAIRQGKPIGETL